MSKDITLLGASYPAVPGVLLPQTGGGTAYFLDTELDEYDIPIAASSVLNGRTGFVNGARVDGSISSKSAATYTPGTANQTIAAGQYLSGAQTILGDADLVAENIKDGVEIFGVTGSYSGGGGGGLVHIASLPTQVIKLSETDFASWTPTTSGTLAVLAAAAAGTFVATDIAEHNYYSRVRTYVDIKYVDDTATAKGMFRKACCENWYAVIRRPSNNANLNSGTFNTGTAEAMSNTWVSQYYNTAWTSIYNGAYGFYPANAAPTFSSTGAASPTITVKNPSITCKCQATYFSTAMANAVDQDASTITFAYDIYRADSGYLRHDVYAGMVDMWNNGLS